MAVPSNICISLPRLSGDLPSVTLPMGAAFGPVVDFASGLPSDCSVMFDLTRQFSVALGQIQCPMAVLEVLQKLKSIVDSGDLTQLLGLAEPLGKLAECFLSITPAQVILSIRDILKAIIKIMSCLIQEIDSILNFRLRLDVNAALTNSKLADILICAQANADTSAASVLKVLESFAVVLNTVASLPGADQLGIPELPTGFQASGKTPSLSDIADVSAINDVLDVLREIVGVLQAIVDKIP